MCWVCWRGERVRGRKGSECGVRSNKDLDDAHRLHATLLRLPSSAPAARPSQHFSGRRHPMRETGPTDQDAGRHGTRTAQTDVSTRLRAQEPCASHGRKKATTGISNAGVWKVPEVSRAEGRALRARPGGYVARGMVTTRGRRAGRRCCGDGARMLVRAPRRLRQARRDLAARLAAALAEKRDSETWSLPGACLELARPGACLESRGEDLVRAQLRPPSEPG